MKNMFAEYEREDFHINVLGKYDKSFDFRSSMNGDTEFMNRILEESISDPFKAVASFFDDPQLREYFLSLSPERFTIFGVYYLWTDELNILKKRILTADSLDRMIDFALEHAQPFDAVHWHNMAYFEKALNLTVQESREYLTPLFLSRTVRSWLFDYTDNLKVWDDLANHKDELFSVCEHLARDWSSIEMVSHALKTRGFSFEEAMSIVLVVPSGTHIVNWIDFFDAFDSDATFYKSLPVEWWVPLICSNFEAIEK